MCRFRPPRLGVWTPTLFCSRVPIASTHLLAASSAYPLSAAKPVTSVWPAASLTAVLRRNFSCTRLTSRQGDAPPVSTIESKAAATGPQEAADEAGQLGPAPYPYGERRVYKQSNRGLYALKRVQYGNNKIPSNKPYRRKTPRRWEPNVIVKRFWSAYLGEWVRTRCSSIVRRTIDKLHGGIDEYLLGMKPRRVKELGPHGWWLRWRVMTSPEGKKHMEMLRQSLKIPDNAEEVERELIGKLNNLVQRGEQRLSNESHNLGILPEQTADAYKTAKKLF